MSGVFMYVLLRKGISEWKDAVCPGRTQRALMCVCNEEEPTEMEKMGREKTSLCYVFVGLGMDVLIAPSKSHEVT